MPYQETVIARSRACPLCGTASGQPCQPEPPADHLARYLDAYTAGKLTRAYMTMTLGEMVVVTRVVMVAAGRASAVPVERGPEHDYCGDGIDPEFEHCPACKTLRESAREPK